MHCPACQSRGLPPRHRPARWPVPLGRDKPQRNPSSHMPRFTHRPTQGPLHTYTYAYTLTQTHTVTHLLSHAHTHSSISAHSHTCTGPMGGSLNSIPCIPWSPQLLPCCTEPRQVLGRRDLPHLPSGSQPKKAGVQVQEVLLHPPSSQSSSHKVRTFQDLPSPNLLTQGRPLDPPQCTAAHPQLPTPSLVGLSVPVRDPSVWPC